MANKPIKNQDELLLEEMGKIKNLLILTLYGLNFPSSEIGRAAKMDGSTIRGMFSKKEILKARKKKGAEDE